MILTHTSHDYYYIHVYMKKRHSIAKEKLHLLYNMRGEIVNEETYNESSLHYNYVRNYCVHIYLYKVSEYII